MAIEFRDNDEGYLQWLDGHPAGFVLNTSRPAKADYLILHRATCGTITGNPARGSRWTTGDYQKICAEHRSELDRWAHVTAGGTPTRCSLCKPG
ncbi:MAG: hypothetical protein M3Q10_08400 [Chloroflexota bacterium]|nr:hypothetical protein [Chloroflexota bacterium]